MTPVPAVALKPEIKGREENSVPCLFLAGITDHSELRNIQQNMLHFILALLLAIGVHVSTIVRRTALGNRSCDRDGVAGTVCELHGAAPQTISIAVTGSDSKMTGFCTLAQTTRDGLRTARFWILS